MNFELQSFVWKFVELSRQGYNAKLSAESETGKVSVTLQLDLGQSSSNFPRSNTSGKKSGGKQARRRRHERRAAMRLAATKEAEVVGEQPIGAADVDVVVETSAEEADVGNDTEEVTSGREAENSALVGEEPMVRQEDVPENWEELVSEEPTESPSFRNVVGIRPVKENGVLLDQNTENIVTFTPSRPALQALHDLCERGRARDAQRVARGRACDGQSDAQLAMGYAQLSTSKASPQFSFRPSWAKKQ